MNLDFYNYYRNNRPSDQPILYKNEYLQLVDKFMKFIVRKVYEGNSVTLPHRVGTLCCIGTKRKITVDEEGNLCGIVNWYETNKYWKSNPEAKKNKELIFHDNAHTNGYMYKIVWGLKRARGIFKNFYAFYPARSFKKVISKSITNNEYEYLTK